MKEEKSATSEPPEVKQYTPKPILRDRAVEICGELGRSFNGDERVDLLLELVMGFSVDRELLEAEGYQDFEVTNYHSDRGIFCAIELHRYTNAGWNAMCDYLLGLGVANEAGGKAVTE